MTATASSKRVRFPHWALATIVCGLMVLFCHSPPGQSLERFVSDAFFHIRGPVSQDPRFVVVAIDDASFGVLQQQWPWPRSWHAQLVDRLFQDGADVVALDIVFADPSDAVDDEAFAQTLSRRSPVILGAQVARSEAPGYTRDMRVGPPQKWLHAGVHIGNVNLPIDPDGFIRRALPAGLTDLIPFAMATAITAGCPDFSLSENGSWRIPFIGPPGTLRSVSYYQALLPGHLPKGFFKNKIVFVGFLTRNSLELEDRQPDHYPVPFSRWGYGYMAGVEIQAQLVQGICSGNLIREAASGWVAGVHLAVWLLGGVFFFRGGPGRGAVIWLLFTAVAGSGAFFLFVSRHTAWPIMGLVLPFSAIYGTRALLYFLAINKEKRFIRQAFSTYVSPQLVAQLIRERKALNLGGEETDISAFFSDIQGFTTISEKLSPRQLVALLNDYLTEMTDILLAHGGTVDKFEGDAIVAFFGAPTVLPDHADTACRCALAMQARLAQLEKIWEDQGRPGLNTRIGICSGTAVVGNMGSRNRLDYTMMGDTPNTASRLEGANKIYGTKILASASTARAATGVRFREIDAVRLKGKNRAITVFEPMELAGRITPADEWLIANYQKALTAYREGKWETAASLFDSILIQHPDDRPSQVMVARCEQFKKDPPVSWDGVFVLMRK